MPEQTLQDELQASADLGGAGHPKDPSNVEPKTSDAPGSEGARADSGLDSSQESPTDPESLAPTFPVDSYRAAAVQLRRPFTAEAVKWKVQSGKLVVPYIDARLVIERLNLVCPHLWHDEYEPLSGGKGLVCRLTIDGITRIDIGGGYQGKGLFSDAFKRAAVKFGVGVSLYALPKLYLDTKNGHLRDTGKKTEKGAVVYDLTDKGQEGLRGGYNKWLSAVGEAKYGKALDHGDVEDAYGDVEAETEAAPVVSAAEPEQPQKLTDAAGAALIEKAEELHSNLPPRKKSLATFKRELAGVWHDEDKLKEYVKSLEAMASA